ncbi:MurR/RpiR family transcriptional regulator [Microbispora hainanensis]|uniref:MurR/RpiR family transcriptional regulator n=1 Tax=Microbispora hainanensis TaxID=568844 RepID=UPI003247D83F
MNTGHHTDDGPSTPRDPRDAAAQGDGRDDHDLGDEGDVRDHSDDRGDGGGRDGDRRVPGDLGDLGGLDDDAASRLLRLFEGHRLTPVQRRIAHCLAQHAAEAPFLSSIEVAELAGVSQPSVTRFATALGYSGYPGLRRRFRELGVRQGRERDGSGRNGEDAGPDARISTATPRLSDGGADGRTGGRGERPAPVPPAPPEGSHRPSPDPGAPARSVPQKPGSRQLAPADAESWSEPLPESWPDLGADRAAGAGGGYRRAVLAEIENLRALARSLDDPGPVAEAARLLAASRPLPVLGLRAAAAQAAGFAYFAAKVHPDVRPLHEAGSLLADRVEQAAAAGATALLCFALPRYPAELLDALRAARAAGLAVVTVADRRVPSLAGLSDVLLTAAVGTHLVFDTACAPMMLGRVLLEAMCDELPGAQARLEAFEASAAARGVFLID